MKSQYTHSLIISSGRVAANGFLSDTPYVVRTRGTTCTSSVPLPPEEVLFRRGMAPERYEENDFYWANQNLTDDQVLPDSDLLKAIHAYVAEFYGRATLDKGQSDVRSMDESALLALGILMEETAKEILGEAGDLVFVEGEEVKEDSVKYYESDVRVRQQSVPVRHESAGRAASKPAEGRKRKRRKIDHELSE